MSGQWQRVTNKMLYHAKTYLKAWEAGESGEAQVFREASAISMATAYRSLLAEVLESYQVCVDRLPFDLNEAVSLLKESRQHSSELDYIRQLEHQSGFLQLINAADEYSVLRQVMAPAATKTSEIFLKDLTPDFFSSSESARDVMDSLSELVAYARNYSFEW